jgi:hypothetical protein
MWIGEIGQGATFSGGTVDLAALLRLRAQWGGTWLNFKCWPTKLRGGTTQCDARL